MLCSLVMGKSQVNPLKPITIRTLELTAALISLKVSSMLLKESANTLRDEIFWTNSETLGYLNNKATRFHVLVSNRVQDIREQMSPNQWHYVGTKCNPANGAQELIGNSLWCNGPDFLWNLSQD